MQLGPFHGPHRTLGRAGGKWPDRLRQVGAGVTLLRGSDNAIALEDDLLSAPFEREDAPFGVVGHTRFMKDRERLLAIRQRTRQVLTVAIFAVVLAGCSQSVPELTPQALSSQGDKAVVRLANFEDGNWTRATIVCPYAPENTVLEVLGIDNPLDTSNDNLQYMIFADEDSIVSQRTVATFDAANLCTMETPDVLYPESELVLELVDGRWELVAFR